MAGTDAWKAGTGSHDHPFLHFERRGEDAIVEGGRLSHTDLRALTLLLWSGLDLPCRTRVVSIMVAVLAAGDDVLHEALADAGLVLIAAGGEEDDDDEEASEVVMNDRAKDDIAAILARFGRDG